MSEMVLGVATCLEVNPTRNLPRSGEEARMRSAETVALHLPTPTTSPIPVVERRRHLAPAPKRRLHRLPGWVEILGAVALFVGGLGISMGAAEGARSVPQQTTLHIERDPTRVATTKTPAPLVKPKPSPKPQVEPRR